MTSFSSGTYKIQPDLKMNLNLPMKWKRATPLRPALPRHPAISHSGHVERINRHQVLLRWQNVRRFTACAGNPGTVHSDNPCGGVPTLAQLRVPTLTRIGWVVPCDPCRAETFSYTPVSRGLHRSPAPHASAMMSSHLASVHRG